LGDRKRVEVEVDGHVEVAPQLPLRRVELDEAALLVGGVRPVARQPEAIVLKRVWRLVGAPGSSAPSAGLAETSSRTSRQSVADHHIVEVLPPGGDGKVDGALGARVRGVFRSQSSSEPHHSRAVKLREHADQPLKMSVNEAIKISKIFKILSSPLMDPSFEILWFGAAGDDWPCRGSGDARGHRDAQVDRRGSDREGAADERSFGEVRPRVRSREDVERFRETIGNRLDRRHDLPT
jgi:hypothetical protein